MLTVPEAARRTGRNPETIRRWIREGKLPSTKVGTQHLIAEQDLSELVEPTADTAPLPPEWQRTEWGAPMPDVVAAVRRSRQGHLGSMRLVIDASVAVDLSLAGGVLGPLRDHELHAPPLIHSEVASIIGEMTHRSEIPADRARGYIERLANLPITIEGPPDLQIRAWDISRALGWAKTYDAEYVALAVFLDAPLVTSDLRLQRGAGHLARVITPTEILET